MYYSIQKRLGRWTLGPPFLCLFLLSLNHDFVAVVDVQAGLGGLGAQVRAAQRVPVITPLALKVPLARWRGIWAFSTVSSTKVNGKNKLRS